MGRMKLILWLIVISLIIYLITEYGNKWLWLVIASIVGFWIFVKLMQWVQEQER